MGFISNLIRGPQGSAFSRLAGADERIKEAQGKIVAINDSIAAKRNQVSDLKADATAAHVAHDQLDADLNDLHSLLG
jgi:septal ring factor EnvC (AmiA/AmiB activator)